MLLGAHFPVRPTLVHALRQAEAFCLEAVQIFGYRRHEFYFDPKTGPQLRLKLDEEIAAWNKALNLSPVKMVAVHSRAVAMLAISDAGRRKAAIKKFQSELELAKKLSARWYIFHLGPYDQAVDLPAGLSLARDSLIQILEGLQGDDLMVVLENVPGGGRRMGASFEELAAISAKLKNYSSRFGFCLDLAHLWGAGYDLRSPQAVPGLFKRFQEVLEPLPVVLAHLNNSKAALGSHLDHHAHLREGHIPKSVYAQVLEKWPVKAGILETPKDRPEADKENLEFLRSLL